LPRLIPRGRDTTKGGKIRHVVIHVRSSEVNIISEVECFHAQLQVHRFTHREVFRHRRINVESAVGAHAQGSRRGAWPKLIVGCSKAVGTDPALRASWHVLPRLTDEVRPLAEELAAVRPVASADDDGQPASSRENHVRLPVAHNGLDQPVAGVDCLAVADGKHIVGAERKPAAHILLIDCALELAVLPVLLASIVTNVAVGSVPGSDDLAAGEALPRSPTDSDKSPVLHSEALAAPATLSETGCWQP
jgi:hypothetical protein